MWAYEVTNGQKWCQKMTDISNFSHFVAPYRQLGITERSVSCRWGYLSFYLVGHKWKSIKNWLQKCAKSDATLKHDHEYGNYGYFFNMTSWYHSFCAFYDPRDNSSKFVINSNWLTPHNIINFGSNKYQKFTPASPNTNIFLFSHRILIDHV